MGTPHPPPPHERHPEEPITAEPRAPTGAAEDGTTSLDALTTTLNRLVLSGTLTTEQARAVLRELALPVPPERPTTLAPPPINLIAASGPASGSGLASGRGPTSGPGTAPVLPPAPAGVGLPPGVVTATGSGTALTQVSGRDVSGRDVSGRDVSGLDTEAERRHVWGGALSEVGGYVGAAFVFGGLVELAGPGWDALTRVEKLLVLAGPAIGLLLVALLLVATAPDGWTVRPRTGSSARRRLVSGLVALAALLSACAVNEMVTGRSALPAASGTAMLVCAIGYALCRGPVLHLALGVTTAWVLGEALHRAGVRGSDLGWGLVLASALWVVLVMARVLSEWTLGVVVAGALGYAGGEALALGRDPLLGYLVVGALAVGGPAGYLWTRRVAVLVVGVIALATVVPEAVTHHAHGALRAGDALLVTGLSIVGASVLGLLLHRRPPTHRADPG